MAVLRLVPSQGPATPVEITLDKVVVGREPTCDLVVSDGSVSRKHATIERRGDGWAIVDQGSANGTFIDSQRVTEQALGHGQELRFGSMAYRVEIEGDDDAATILTSAPDATVLQEAMPPRPAGPPSPPPPPAVKSPAPPWAAPPKAPVVKPAPPLTSAMPHCPVRRPQASAMCTAAASWRTWISFRRVPSAASNSGMMWLPDNVKIVVRPAASSARATMSAPRIWLGM